MNRPDKAGEPSMEEILASIRQIIADEPRADDQGDAPIEANPLVPQSRATRSPDTPLPLADRLSGVFKSGSLAPTSPFGSKRAHGFDQDLADIFDESEVSSSAETPAPKPEVRASAELSHPMASKSFVPKQAASGATLGAELSSDADHDPVLAPPPVTGVEAAPDTNAKAATGFSFPPMRQTGFYPPQSSVPEADQLVSAQPEPEAPTVQPSSEPLLAPPPGNAIAEGSSNGIYPPHVAEALRRLENGGPAFPDVSEQSAASLPKNGGARILRGSEAARPSTIASPGVSSSTPFSSPFAVTKLASSQTPSEPDPVLEPLTSPPPPFSFGGEKPQESKRGPTFSGIPREPSSIVPSGADNSAMNGSRIGKPLESEQRAEPEPVVKSESPVSGTGVSATPRFDAGPGMTSEAAHQALDALALGLAASAAGPSVIGAPSAVQSEPETLAPAIALTPVVETHSPAAAPTTVVPSAPEQAPAVQPQPAAPAQAASPSTLPAPVQNGAGSMPVSRSLEDAVADMLRPMLQQWVADNMPRIIEKALRNEVASAMKPGPKSGS